MLIGYARVSTHEQSLALQQDALEKAGWARTFTDIASGTTAERDGLSAAFDYVRAGDTLVVWHLDRLGRSLARAQPNSSSTASRCSSSAAAASARSRSGWTPRPAVGG